MLVRSHMVTLRLFLARSPLYHLSAISEKKLDPIVKDAFVSLDGYTLLRYDRKTNGRGAALYTMCYTCIISVTRLCSSKDKWSSKAGVPEQSIL